MSIPSRLQFKPPDASEISAFCTLCDFIEDGVRSREDVSVHLAQWNARAGRVFEPHEFTQYSGAVDQRVFVLSALMPRAAVVSDLTSEEALAVIECVMTSSLPEEEISYFLGWLEVQFPQANVSDLIFWPDQWFGVPEALQYAFTPEQLLHALMERAGRSLLGAKAVFVPFPVPQSTARPAPAIRAMALQVRPATRADADVIFRFICELAEYEKLRDEVHTTADQLADQLFGANPAAEVVIGEIDGTPRGFALFFHNFSTWEGKRGLYLEDLYVEQASRGSGLGKALLVHLAKLALERGCARFEWSVLDWNEPALQFYRALGAKALDGWTVHRVEGEALLSLSASSSSERRPRLPALRSATTD